MKPFLPLLLLCSLAAAGLRADPRDGEMVLVEGGPFLDTNSNFYGRTSIPDSMIGRPLGVDSFLIGRHEVTQREWVAVMPSNPSRFSGDDLPVESVSWYDCIEYCNRRSVAEGLSVCYTVDRENLDPDNHTEIDDVRWRVVFDATADGYRLPTEMEWEYAAGGGRASRSRTYCGGDDAGAVGWFWQNSGEAPLDGAWSWSRLEQNHNGTHPVGTKAPNELGLFDMSGNVREWCWDWYGDLAENGAAPTSSTGESGRVWKGGGWIGADFCCMPSFRAGLEANGKGPDQGFRLCRNAPSAKP